MARNTVDGSMQFVEGLTGRPLYRTDTPPDRDEVDLSQFVWVVARV